MTLTQDEIDADDRAQARAVEDADLTEAMRLWAAGLDPFEACGFCGGPVPKGRLRYCREACSRADGNVS